jgi:hypothetical protein
MIIDVANRTQQAFSEMMSKKKCKLKQTMRSEEE